MPPTELTMVNRLTTNTFSVILLGGNYMLFLLLLPLTLAIAAFNDDDDNTFFGDQTLEGTSGNDAIATSAGDDQIFGGAGDDLLGSGAGDDRAFGAEGDDIVIGQSGDDFLRGGSDDDFLVGGAGEDTLLGDTGNDTIQLIDTFDDADLDGKFDDIGALAAVALDVDLSNETGEADEGNGGFGADFLLFGSNDIVTGGDGNDEFATGFWVNPGEPATVTDFEPGQDVLLFEYDGNTEPTPAFVDTPEGTALTIDGQVVLVLENVNPVDVSLSDVMLAQTTV